MMTKRFMVRNMEKRYFRFAADMGIEREIIWDYLEKRKEKSEARKSEETKQEMKVYIRGTGGTIVTKSILTSASKLKWLFR